MNRSFIGAATILKHTIERYPAKAAVDLRYFTKATLTSDLMWIVRGALATFSGSFSKGREENRLPSCDSAEWRIS
jgi:lipopolysaccharide/colanic/teichoic acid biosynthesis glycosyltransferase